MDPKNMTVAELEVLLKVKREEEANERLKVIAEEDNALLDAVAKLLEAHPNASMRVSGFRIDDEGKVTALRPSTIGPVAKVKTHTSKDHPKLSVGASYKDKEGEYVLLVLAEGKLKVGRADGDSFHSDTQGTKWDQGQVFTSVSAAAEACTADRRLRGDWILSDGTWHDTAGAGAEGKNPSVNGWGFWVIG